MCNGGGKGQLFDQLSPFKKNASFEENSKLAFILKIKIFSFYLNKVTVPAKLCSEFKASTTTTW